VTDDLSISDGSRELRAARARIVEAGDAERGHLERNLHDRAQQRLVSVALLLRLAATKVDRDPAGTRRALEQSGEELAELRELARDRQGTCRRA
jgi:signal transduction histidine kinase